MHNIKKNTAFWALFGTQFLGGFNDNFFRTALITLITYHLTHFSETVKSLFVSAAFGLFILPFFIFSPFAGRLTDIFEKSKIIKIIKAVEIFIVIFGAYGFVEKNPYYLLGVLFLMGTHSSFFGPVKYSILPDILSRETLLKGNGYIEAGTFMAIMLGTLCGAVMIHLDKPLFISLVMFCVALAGFLMALKIPVIGRGAPNLKLHFNWKAEMKRLYSYTHHNPRVFKSVISISWFWFVGTLLLAQLPSLVEGILNIQESAFILLLMLLTFGIGLGSILSHWLFKGEITPKYVPFLVLLLIPFLFDISSFRTSFAPTETSLSNFLTSFKGWRFAADIFGLSFIGGLYIVPLYAFIQTEVDPSKRSQVIAFNNILNAGFMLLASLMSFILLSCGLTIPLLIMFCGLVQIGMFFFVIPLFPDPFLKKILYKLFKFLFRLEVTGLENYKAAGTRIILIANHLSYLDALLIASVLPEKPIFAINILTAQKWWLKPFLSLAKVFPIDPKYPYALRNVIKEAKKGQKVIIFPEGRITNTGSLMKIYEGPGMVAEKAGAVILPIRIEGAQYSFFSVLKGYFPRHLFPKISLTILPGQLLSINPSLVGKARRQQLSEQLYDMMTTMIFSTSPLDQTLFSSLLESRKKYGPWKKILEDSSRKVLSYNKLLLRIFTFSHFISRYIGKENQPVGILLPNSHAFIIIFWSLSARGRIPAPLNFSSGSQVILKACQLSRISLIFTSRQFVERAHLQEVIKFLKIHKIHIHYLETEYKKISFRDKIWGIYGMIFSRQAYKKMLPNPDPEDACVLLFTSGSEGFPKGVILSHRNLQANCHQLEAIIDFNQKDLVVNVLPLFHAFGLTTGMLLPLLSGIKTFHYVSPLHYRIVAELIYDIGATILFGTDTFLLGYGRVAHNYDFHTLRYVFAGAEKLKAETQQLWFDKFGLRILEGYGTTETSPVLSVNTITHYKKGTVGRFLPSISYQIHSIEDIDEGGRLFVKGPNIMKGYLLRDSPGTLISPPEGWYDTGDIVTINNEGYVTIKGRAARFSKIGGEMISLVAVEEAIYRLWPNFTHGIIGEPDRKKGEHLILFTTFPFADRSALIAFWKMEGFSDLSLPRVIKILPSLPLLSTGKINYKALDALLY